MTHYKVQQILESIVDVDDLLFADGFDEAILGFDTESRRVVYSQQRMINILVAEGMELEDAVEFLGFNVWSAYVGEHTPIFIIEVIDVDDIEI